MVGSTPMNMGAANFMMGAANPFMGGNTMMAGQTGAGMNPMEAGNIHPMFANWMMLNPSLLGL